MQVTSDCFISAQWPAPSHVRAGVTTRLGGTSEGVYASFNLAAHVGDSAVAVATNRQRLRNSLALPREPIWLQQVHGCAVVQADQCADDRCGDAVVSSAAGTVCAVLTADCLPVLLTDRAGTCVAAAHAGWRGLAAGVLEATVQKLPVSPKTLLAWLGPAIGPRAFEVGDEVRAEFLRHHSHASAAFVPSPNQRWYADLYLLARQRLIGCGVQDIFGGEYCTCEDSRHFYSYRRDGVTGRMASLIWLARE